jgi:tellurite resistance protein TehA-like permease
MGLATIINMIVFVCVPAWGDGAVILAWTLWWIDAALSLASCLYLPFIIMYKHAPQLHQMTAAWLLPIVATIVASATGGVVAEVLPNPQHRLWTIIVSYILWGTGFPLAMVALVMYFHRLTTSGLPAREVIVSVFLPLGPLGQGSFALMQLGKVALTTFPETKTLEPSAGIVFYNAGHALALVIWGYGLVWLFFALASISRSRFPFNMGWWGFTFPLGVYSVATTTFAKNLPSEFFKVLGTIFSLLVVLLWLGVSLETARRAIAGTIFFAPCVQKYEEERAEKDRAKANLEKEKSEGHDFQR